MIQKLEEEKTNSKKILFKHLVDNNYSGLEIEDVNRNVLLTHVEESYPVTLDTKKIKLEMPEIYEEYGKKGKKEAHIRISVKYATKG